MMDFKEWQYQAYVCTELKRAGIFHHGDQNAGKRGPKAQAQAKATGMCAGWPDLVVFPDVGRILFFEFKTPKGKQSQSQKDVEKQLTKLGFEYYIVQENTPQEAWEFVKSCL